MDKKEFMSDLYEQLVKAEHVLDTQYSFELAEPHYRKCLSIIEQAPAYQNEFENLLLEMYFEKMISDEPLAYLMHVLRWPNVRKNLELKIAHDSTAIATGRSHEKVLAAYHDEWANREFYRFSP